MRDAARLGFREFVMRDVDGHVDKIRVDLTANPGLLEALNTTAGRHAGEDRDTEARGMRRNRAACPGDIWLSWC